MLAISWGRWLKQRRKALDLTQAEFAQRVGCAVTTIRKLEADMLRPSRQLAARIAHALELTTEEERTCVQLARMPLTQSSPTPLPGTHAEHVLMLPTVSAPLVGREAELAQLALMLADPACRLLTLTGLGGIGKTHLALQAAATQYPHFLDGVVWVPLGTVSQPELLVPTLAEALDVRLSASGDPQRQLRNYLRNKHVLLVLDNMEHLLAGTDLLLDLLRHAPAVKVLVTSRERLSVPEEWVVDVGGLAVPGTDVPREQLATWPAVALFLQTAQRMCPTSTAAHDLASVADICRLVDGMPLGIELAAAWVRVLPYAEIAKEIAQSSNFLARTQPHLSVRHQSLQAVFDQSWTRLSPAEQQVLCHFSVVRGGCTRHAAEQVAGASLPLLASLVDKSLLYHTLTGRYTLHELVRQYAGSKLHALPGGEDAAHDRHCTYYTEFLYAHTASLEGGAQAESEAAISADIDNIRAAWQWAAIHSKTHELQHAVTGLFYFYELRNWFAEGDDLCQLAIKHLRHANADNVVHNEEHVRVSGQILAVQAAFCFRRYPSMYATELLYSSLALLRQIDAQAEQAQPLFLLGLLAYLRGEYTEAQQRLHESLALSSKHNNQWLMAHVLGVLGMVAHAEGDLATARGSMYDGIAIFRSLGDQHYITRGLSQLSVVECSMRAYDTAYALLHESIALSRTNGDRWGLAISLNHLGMLEYTRGHFATAHSLLKEGLASCVDLGDLRESAHAHICLGDVAAAIGDDDDAFQHYQAAIQTAQEAQVLPMTVRALYGVATLLVKQGHYAVAIPLLHAILHHAASEQEIKTSAAKLIRQCNEQAVPQHEADYDLPEWAQMVGGTVPQLAHINLDALFLEHPP